MHFYHIFLSLQWNKKQKMKVANNYQVNEKNCIVSMKTFASIKKCSCCLRRKHTATRSKHIANKVIFTKNQFKIQKRSEFEHHIEMTT